MNLKHAEVGKYYRIVKILGKGPVKRRIMDMGITKNVEIYIRKVAPLGDPVQINLRGYELSLRKDDAENILIELINKMFNALTGSNQYVGNWPGVTVEKKEGTLKNNKDIKITDLPGIYSLSPYTLEEVVSRNYLINEKPDVIIDVVDASNIERNLYLTTQLSEIGIPMVLAFNMMDVVKKNNDKLNTKLISEKLGIPIVEVSALKKLNLDELIEVAQKQVKSHHESILLK